MEVMQLAFIQWLINQHGIGLFWSIIIFIRVFFLYSIGGGIIVNEPVRVFKVGVYLIKKYDYAWRVALINKKKT